MALFSLMVVLCCFKVFSLLIFSLNFFFLAFGILRVQGGNIQTLSSLVVLNQKKQSPYLCMYVKQHLSVSSILCCTVVEWK
jgi:hypothetical protein